MASLSGQLVADPSKFIPDTPDPAQFIPDPPAPPRGALGEIGTGIRRGALVDLPALAGRALQYVSEPGRPVYEAGRGMVASADERGLNPALTLRPEEHNAVTNAIAQGGSMLAQALPVVAAGTGAALVGLPGLAATGVGALTGGALFGAAAGQDTLEKAEKAGLDEHTAKEAARINAATTMAGQTALGMVGGRMLGAFGKPLNSLFGRESASLAESTWAELSGAGGVLAPVMRSTAVGAVEGVATNAAQSAASAGIERAYGVDNTSPVDAAIGSVAPTLGLTALMGPMALVSRAMNVRAAKTRTEALAHPEAPPEIRTQLADAYAERLAAVDPAAAEAFRTNAATAIKNKLALPVDSSVLSPDAVVPPAPPPPAETTPLLGRDPRAGNLVVFPDGTTGFASEIEQHLASLPPEQQVIERARMLGQGQQEVPLPTLREAIEGQPPSTEVADRLAAGRRAQLELQDLHGQVRTTLQDAGIEPALPLSREEFAAGAGKGKSGQVLARAYRDYLANPDTQADLMRRDADAYDALQQRLRDEQQAGEAVTNPPPDAARSALPPEAAPPNTAMADAMTAALKKRDEALAYQQRDETKARETDAIANIAKGEQQAADAEAGRIQGDPNAPKARDAIEADWKATMEANEMDTKRQSLVPLMKRLDSMGALGVKTHEEQIAALEKIAADKTVSQSQRDRADMLAKEWRKEMPRENEQQPPEAVAGTPAAQAPVEERPTGASAPAASGAGLTGKPDERAQAALGENLPPAAPAKPTGAPIAGSQAPVAVAHQSNIPLTGRNMPVTEMAEAAADRVAALRAEFTDRIRKGEQLSPLEQERYEDLAGFARSLQPFLEGNAKPRDAEYVKALTEMVEQASGPYEKSLRRMESGTADNPNATSPALEAATTLIRGAGDLMGHLAETGSQPWVKDLAKKLQPLMGKTSIERTQPDEVVLQAARDSGFDGDVVAEYHPPTDAIRVYKPTESTILHEAVHAATESRLQEAEKIGKPANQREAALKRAYQDLVDVYEEAKKRLGASKQYGMTDVHEFVAEMHANDRFRTFLDGQGLMSRVWDGIRRLLGMQTADVKLLQRALDASEPFFSTERIREEFDASPDGAARATSTALQRAISRTDEKAYSVDVGRAALGALKWVLPLQTGHYFAHRVRTNPELKASGYAAGVDAHMAADDAHNIVLNRLQDVGSKYVAQVDRLLRGMPEHQAKAIEREMSYIGGEASRIGFDYRLNGRDNLAADKTLDVADKAAIDDVHRRFKQLQQKNPEAARLLEEGERLNRRSLIEKVATVAANLMDDSAGRARILEAELQRMDPADARRAELANQVKLRTTEALMAGKHSKGLDLLDATLAQGKNPDPVRFHDESTANLGSRLQRAFNEARTLPEGSPLRNAMSALETIYAKESKNPYFSLGRDGDFFVKVGFKGIDKAANERIQKALENTNKVVGDLTRGDSHAFFRVGSAAEAQALHDRLVKAGEGKVLDTAWGRLSEKTQEAANVSPALRTLLASVDDMHLPVSGPQALQVKQALTRQLLSMLPETASRSAQMGRRGIPGYDADFLTQFSQRAQGAVHDTAGVYTGRAYMDAARMRSQAIDQLNRTGSTDARQRAQLVDDEINKRYANLMKPVPPDWVSQATSFSHSFYLGMSPAFFIRTMVQPWHRGLPFLGSKFGFMGSMGEMAAAMPTGLKLVQQSLAAALKRDGVRGLLNTPVELQGLGLSQREQAWVNEAHAMGKFDLGESSQLVRAAMGASKLQDAMRYAATTAQYAEMSTRFSIGLAALRLATKKPQLLSAGETPEMYAHRAMETAMDDFSPSNTARAIGRHGFAGTATPLFAQFQNYNLQTMQQIARTVHDGLFNQDKSPEGLQRAKEARREFAGLMATTGAIAGTLGLPFANVFAGVYNSLMSDPDDPKDVRVSMRNWAATTFGPEMGAVLMKGLPSVLNLDSTTFGNQGILPGSDFLADRTAWKERSEAQVRNALGPAISLGLDFTQAVANISDGNWLKGVEAALPVGLRSFYKTGAMLAGDGFYTDSKNNPLPMRIGASDIAWRALGFQTESKATQGEATRDFIINEQLRKRRSGQIVDQFVKGSRDPAEIPDAVSALTAYNAKNPLEPITRADISRAVIGSHTRFALGEASGLGIAVSKRKLPVLQNEERFAAMPSR